MACGRSAAIVGLVALILTGLPGCVVKRRLITRQAAANGAPRTLLNASRDDLVRRLRLGYDAVRSFNATTDMTPALGSVNKGEITEYTEIRAYVLFRKPADIRIIGLLPVVHSKAFDMTSMGQDFRISIPSKNRFIQGRNDAPPASKNSLENLRPEAFFEAMLIPPPDDQQETPLLLDSTDEEQALYILVLVGHQPDGTLTINRTIFFDRASLLVVRQKRYNARGQILSDTRYKDWKVYNGVQFPGNIDINRPQDGYGVVMNLVKLEMNPQIADDKFVLERPEGSQLQVIGPPR